MGTTAPAVKAALVAAARTLFVDDEDVAVLYGYGGAVAGKDLLVIGNIATSVTRPLLGASSREEVHEVFLMASVRRGFYTQQQAATERAYVLVDTLAEHLRTHPNETFGIGVRVDSWISGYELDEFTEDRESQVKGPYAALGATLTVTARI